MEKQKQLKDLNCSSYKIPCMDLPILFNVSVTALGSRPESIKMKVSVPHKCAKWYFGQIL